jgi:ubiquinone/menaquinone biosynthesis C-methylase UbiE
MGKAEWGADPEFFGPRHAHREGRITGKLARLVSRPGPHLECAAGVGSLSVSLAERGHRVISADLSFRSLRVLVERARAAGLAENILPVVCDITALPFADSSFSSASCAETLEHVEHHNEAVGELGRILKNQGWLVGTVPAGPGQWSDWDDWAGHLRRYSAAEMQRLLANAGLEATTVVWGWPFLRIYDGLFLKRINRRRLQRDSIEDDSTLRTVAAIGQKRWLVRAVRAVFSLDRLFDGAPWGVGLLFSAQKR